MKSVPEKASEKGPPKGPQKDRPAPSARLAEATPAPERIPNPPPPGRGLTPQSLQRLQGAAGNAAVSRLVAQRYTAPVKPPPSQAPGMRRVTADIAAKKQKLSRHNPATAESRSAQDAAKAPPDDKEAQGKAANAEKMNAARPGEFDKAAFITAVNEAIAAQAPKNLEEADEFADSGKAEKVKGQVDGKVTDGKKASAKDIETTTKAAPDTSQAKEKQVVPMHPDQPPANPGAPSAADATPQQQPPEVTDFSEGPKKNDQQMADADVTEEQLAKGNEPEFTSALGEKRKAEQHSATAPTQARAAEKAQLATAKSGAAAAGAQAMNALTATRNAAGKQVDGGKGEAKSKDEQKRAEVTGKLQKVFDATQKDVEGILTGLDGKVDKQFGEGEKKARDAFNTDQKRRMKQYKDKRYSGFWGPAKWAKDKIAGMPEEANQLFQESRKLYVRLMQGVISSIADTIGTELGKAKARIAKGRSDLKTEVDKLPADLKQYGEEAAKDFAGKFDDLESEVNDKSKQLVQTLAQKYTQALHAVDEEIKKLQEANKGLVQKAVDAVKDAINTIKALKNLLMGILAKAAAAIAKIIEDPIGFLGNLVHAVGAGLHQFMSNIGTHLQSGLVSWLLGTAVKGGIEIPSKFDLKGIIQLIASLLGLTWANIRARITRKGIPDQAMNTVEQSVPVAKALATEGPAGAVNEIFAEVGDLKSTILEDLKSYLIPTVIIAGITWILSLLNPASAFVRAVKGIVDIVSFIVNQGAQIVEFVNAVLDAVVAIANGGSAGVPKMVETALAASIPLLIGFLASLLGIGGLANKIKQVFQKVARPVNRAIDKIVGFIAKKGRALWQKFRGKKKGPGGKNESPRAKEDRLKKAMAAAVRAMDRYSSRSVTAVALRPALAAIRARYGLKELVPVPDGEKWAVRGRVNPHATSSTTAIRDRRELVKRYLPLFGNRLVIEPAHAHWMSRQIAKTKLWDAGVLKSTTGAARQYLRNPATVDAVNRAHFEGQGTVPNRPNAYKENVFKTGSGFRKELLEALGSGRAVDVLRAKGLEKAAEGSEARSRLEQMNFVADSPPYGAFKPFPDGTKDPDPNLKEAVLKSTRGDYPPLLAFLFNMVEFGAVGDISWRRFNELWNTHSDSVNWLKDRFRDLDPGMHEWIPTNYLRAVLQTAVDQKNRTDLRSALKWVTLHHALRSSTNMVLWRIVDASGKKVDPGGHVGSFYEAYRGQDGNTKYKSTMTNGTGDFHGALREIFNENKGLGASGFVSVLEGRLPGLIWNGDVGGLPSSVLEAKIGALYQVPDGGKAEISVEALGVQQRLNYAKILNDFRDAKASIES
ncbi:hypothetical protein ACWD5V_08215 [Streptomyces sp. NPDC002523]